MTGHIIQLNHAGASPSPPSVVEAITRHLRREMELGGYAAAEAAAPEIEVCYRDIAGLLGAERDEVAITSGGSAAWNAIFTGLELQAGDRIITTASEYGGAVAAMRARASGAGVHIDVAPAAPSGAVDLARLERMITKRTRLISLTWIPTRYGIIEPAGEVGQITRAHGIFFLLDAAQALGQRPIDVSALGCDALIACGRKFLRGPRGTGILFIARRCAEVQPVQLDHWIVDPAQAHARGTRSDAARFELWERSPALILGLGAAVREAQQCGLDLIRARSEECAAALRRGLREIRGVNLADPAGAQAPLIGFTLDGVPATQASASFWEKRIAVSVSHPRSSPLAVDVYRNEPVARVSPHYCTAKGEVDVFLDAMTRIVEGAR